MLTSVSSNRTTPTNGSRFTVAHGMTCFCPVSAIAHHHAPTFGAQIQSRISALSALFALR